MSRVQLAWTPSATPRTAIWNGVLVWMICGGADASEVDRVAHEFMSLGHRGQLAGLMVVVDDSGWTPSLASQRAARAFLQRADEKLHLVAVVFESEGWRASLLRATLASVSSHVRRPYPLRVFGDARCAASWVCGQVHDGAGTMGCPQQLGAEISKLRP